MKNQRGEQDETKASALSSASSGQDGHVVWSGRHRALDRQDVHPLLGHRDPAAHPVHLVASEQAIRWRSSRIVPSSSRQQRDLLSLG